MIFEPTAIEGVIVVRPVPRSDPRGDFARLWCESSFAAAGYRFRPTQISTSRNRARHTLRGLHWQAAPHGETKLVRAASGRIHDVAVDMRPGSPTWLQSCAVELDSTARNALLIPPGCAHGYLTLTEDAEVIYLIDAPHVPSAASGACHDDPALGIVWPARPALISERDQAWPSL